MRETGRGGFKESLIRNISARFPGCVILHNDPQMNFQGIPDILVLYKGRWAMLEAKASPMARKRPNQAHYIDMFNDMSYAAFVYPENEEEILNDLQQAFQPRRTARIPQR